MTLRLNGSTSGYTEIDAPAVAGSNTVILPSGNGSANQFLKNGSTAGTLGWSGVTEDSSGNFAFNSGYGSVATAYGCRAWVNFNGTGTVAIRASGNVSSITDEAVGKFTINFTTAMADTNYILCGSASFRDGTDDSNSFKVCHRRLSSGTLTTSACAITTASVGDSFSDPVIACVAFFR